MALYAMYARESQLPASGAEKESKYMSPITQTMTENCCVAETELLDFLLETLQHANPSVSADCVHRA